ncbi:hypothetical protein C0Q70_16575 [Pomacea canaliculata]|uniref:Uncharacterized protein n=1 Tax=Pomacea canaliculata TaxID=400727 RepID=A0A2T7NQ58_POMCA|nr:hypothetical protein C0Q70_16575 [Pomacea canaliculata]
MGVRYPVKTSLTFLLSGTFSGGPQQVRNLSSRWSRGRLLAGSYPRISAGRLGRTRHLTVTSPPLLTRGSTFTTSLLLTNPLKGNDG